MRKRDWLWVALMVSVLLNVLLAGRAAKTKQAEVVRADTIVVRDTVRIVEPIHIKETIVRHDTVFFPVYKELDSTSNLTSNLTSNQDSAKVVIPITERTYEDSTYKAVVRGYKPELASLDIYNSTRIKTIIKTKQPKVVVGIGPYAGFGNKGFNYGIAVNVSMPIWSW